MRYFANHILMITVAMVRVSHTGMKISCVLLWNNEGRNVRAANPTMMIVRSISRRDDDFFAPPVPCDVS